MTRSSLILRNCMYRNSQTHESTLIHTYLLNKKKIENYPKFEKMPISQPLVILGQNPLACEGHLDKGSQSCPFGQDP